MSNWLWWTLAGSVLLAVVIIFATWFIMHFKIKKLKNESIYKPLTNPDKNVDDDKANPIVVRGDKHGHLLWDLKDKTKNPLEDIQMEFIINTLIKNQYKKVRVYNENHYISESIKKLAFTSVVKSNYEAVILENNQKLNDIFDEEIKVIKKGGMILVINAKRDKNIKKLLSFTKMIGKRREYLKIGKGIVLIVN